MDGQRVSSINILPGHTAILNDHDAFSQTNFFQYFSQLHTATTVVAHPLNLANLFMAWHLNSSAWTSFKFGEAAGEITGTGIQLPFHQFYFDDPDDDGDVNLYDYSHEYVRLNRNDYECIYNALDSAPATALESYVRIAIFNDTFAADFVEPEIV